MLSYPRGVRMQYDKVELGNRIYFARNNKKLKQIDVCNKLRISQSTYSKIETGKIEITLSDLFDLSEILDVPLSWLIGINSDDDFTDEELYEINKFKRYIKSIRKKG